MDTRKRAGRGDEPAPDKTTRGGDVEEQEKPATERSDRFEISEYIELSISCFGDEEERCLALYLHDDINVIRDVIEIKAAIVSLLTDLRILNITYIENEGNIARAVDLNPIFNDTIDNVLQFILK